MNEAFKKLSDTQLMALTICREAGGEPLDGQIAVGTVILERVDHRNWDGKTIQEVCLKKWQFSCFNETDKGYRKTLYMAEAWDQCIVTDISLMNCYTIADGMLAGRIPRNPILAAHHCCQYLNPKGAAATKEKWIESGMHVILTIKNHDFFAEKG